jgi:predicted transcriptional regulator with HTH domain
MLQQPHGLRSASNGFKQRIMYALHSIFMSGSPVLAEVGAAQTAFAGPPNNTGCHKPLLGQQTGHFSLTDGGMSDGAAPPPVVSFSTPITPASGVILDAAGSLSTLISILQPKCFWSVGFLPVQPVKTGIPLSVGVPATRLVLRVAMPLNYSV